MRLSAPIPIIGTGHSGTGYISALLNTVGVRCGHEEYWNLHDPPERHDLVYDASWMAIGYARKYRRRAVLLTRHPLDIFYSFAAKRWENTLTCPYYRRAVSFYDESWWSPVPDDQVWDAAVYTVQMGWAATEAATERLSLEYLVEDDLVGLGADPELPLTKLMAGVPQNINYHGDPRGVPSGALAAVDDPDRVLKHLPVGLRADLFDLCDVWGYRV